MGFLKWLSNPPDVLLLKEKKDIKGLIKSLKYKYDLSIRISAAEALGEMGRDLAIKPLCKTALNDSDYNVRKTAAKALGRFGQQGIKRLAAVIEGVCMPSERDAALYALVSIGDQAVKPLINILSNYKYKIEKAQEAAAIALGEIGDSRAIKPLVHILKQEDSSFRANVEVESFLNALIKVSRSAPEPLIDVLNYGIGRRARKLAENKLVDIGAPVVEPLIDALKKGNLNTAGALGRIGDHRAVEPLIAKLGIIYVIGPLGEIGDPRAIEPLIKVLKNSSSYYTSEEAAEALVKIGNDRAINALIEVLYGGCTGSVRKAAASALINGWRSNLSKEQKEAVSYARYLVKTPHKDVPSHDCYNHNDNACLGGLEF